MSSNRHLVIQQKWFPFWLGLCLTCVFGLISPTFLCAKSKKVRIAILPRPGKGVNQDTSAWLQRFLQWSMRKQQRIVVLKNKHIQKILTEQTIPPSFHVRMRVCRRYIKRAKQLYNMRQMPLARRSRYVLKALRVAEKMITRIKIHLKDPKIIQDLLLYRTLAYAGLGRKTQTRSSMLKFVQFAPEFDTSGRGLPTSFKRYHSTIVRWLKGQNRYTMKLDSIPSNAKIYHNYRYLGRTPYSLNNLVPGSHFIRIVAPGYKVWEKSATLNSRKLGSRRVITVKIPLQRDPAALSIDETPIFAQDAAISDDIMDKLKAIIKRLNIKHLYIVEARHTSAGEVLRIATFKMGYTRIRYRVVPIGRTRASYRTKIIAFTKLLGQSIAPAPIVRRVRRFRPRPRKMIQRKVRRIPIPPRIVAVRREPKTIQPQPIRPILRRKKIVKMRPRIIRKPQPPQVTGPTPFYGTWWFWTATIGGVALATAGVAVIANLNGPPPNATLIITTQSSGNTP